MGSKAGPSSGVRAAQPEDLVARAAAGLPARLSSQRWFGGKARTILRASPLDRVAIPGTAGILALFEVAYAEGAKETYLFPPLPGGAGRPFTDAVEAADFCAALVEQVRLGGSLAGLRGIFRFTPTEAFADIVPAGPLDVAGVETEQSHTSVVLGGTAILKLFRKLEPGPNPELEITDHLTRRTAFRGAPRLAGSIAYETAGAEPTTLALVQAFVPNHGDAWTAFQAGLAEYYAAAGHRTTQPGGPDPAFAQAHAAADAAVAARLGELTGRLHTALASAPAGTPLAPAPIAPADLVTWQAGMRSHLERVMGTLARSLDPLPAPVRDIARQVLADAPHLGDSFAALAALGTERVTKIRVHGDYHLGQVLWSGDAFVILDFEGEPDRPLAERRAKQCALKDVAGMLRSFAYAAQAALLRLTDAAPEDVALRARLAPWADAWLAETRRAFLEGYLAQTWARGAAFLPRSREVRDAALRAFELDKAIYEVHYELNHRPAWLRIPLEGLRGRERY